ncbi:MAG: hypothetical protein ACFE0Q_09245 [Anaerolineae bacterium]
MMNQTSEQQETTHNIKQILAPNFTFTKRQLGIILLSIGGLAFIAILAIDLIGGGRESGIGPAQASALVVMAGVALLGASLIPLGDKPA